VDQGSLLAHAGQVRCLAEQVVVQVQGRSHAYKYALLMQICQEKKNADNARDNPRAETGARLARATLRGDVGRSNKQGA
jgi:hypothetical protein